MTKAAPAPAPAPAAAAAAVPGLRITTSADRQVECAGFFWAGVSELPAAIFNPQQLEKLRSHDALKVEDIELPAAEARAT